MAPFYSSVCAEVGRTLDSDLLNKMEAENVKELAELEKEIENAEKNFGETEQRDALLAKADYLCKIGSKVCGRSDVLVCSL
jgi:26S proteasome regulatory subunit N7